MEYSHSQNCKCLVIILLSSCYHNKWLCFPNVPQQCTIQMSVSPIRLFVIKILWLTTYCHLRKLILNFHIKLSIFEYHAGVLATQTSLHILSTLELYKVQLNTYLQIFCTGYPRPCQYSLVNIASSWLPKRWYALLSQEIS